MLEQTISRAELMIPPDRLFIVVGRSHLEFREAAGQLAARPPGTVIVQPANKETGPGILLPLMHLVARHPDSVAVIFPSDHYIAEAELFMDHVEQACRAVERDPNQLILLGVEPHAAEPEYGYILPGRRATDHAGGVTRIARFYEKPQSDAAERLIHQGALWNTFVMVARPDGLLDLVRRLVPWLYHDFLAIRRAIGTGREQAVTEEIYRALTPVNFSTELLQRITLDDPLRVSVMPVRGVWWNDWGSEQRLVSDLEKWGERMGDGRSRLPLGGIMAEEMNEGRW
jgi:mannose-1-phosphate guanylyltransferase